MEKLAPGTPLVRMWNGAAAVENSTAVPQKVKGSITKWPSNSASGYLPRRIESRGEEIFLHPRSQQAARVSTGSWTDKHNVVCSYDVETHSCNSIDDPWGQILSEISQTQEYKFYDSTYKEIRVVKFIKTAGRTMVAKGWGEGMELLLSGSRMPVWEGNVL